MAEGLQYKENLTLISGGYPGEGTGSNGLVQNWTDTTGDSGSSTVTYYYHDSATVTDANSTYVEINITDNWTAVKDNRNYYHITVSTVINYIRRTKVGNPSPLSVYMFARHDAGGANIWTSGGCVDAANSGTNATNINMGTTTIDLAPGQSTNVHGTVYFRSNICGHNNAKPPSIYVDEFWLGVNFRNTLPPDYRPGKTWNGSEWLSHNRGAGSYVSSKNLFSTSIRQGVTDYQTAQYGGSATRLTTSDWVTLPAGTYTVSAVSSRTIRISNVTFTTDGDFYNIPNVSGIWQTAPVTFTTPIAIKWQCNISYPDNGNITPQEVTNVQLEKGSTATPYEPYTTQYFSSGATDIYTSATSKNTMRTQDGGVGTNNPPYTRHNDNTWRNQRKVGLE